MFNRLKPFKRVVAIVTCACFLMSDLLMAAPGTIQFSLPRETPSFLQIDIPSDLAQVDELYEAPPTSNPEMILHIQNAHTNYDAQTKIKKLIEHFEKEYGFKTIFAEGAAGELKADRLKVFPEKEMNLELADRLAKKGLLTGVDLYVMEHEDKVRALGIEDTELYFKNHAALKKVFEAEDELSKFLKVYDSKLDQLSSKIFSNDLREVLSEWEKFEEGHREFLPYVKGLSKFARKHLDLDLSSLFSQIDWPQLTRILVIGEMETVLDRRQAETEKKKVLEWLKKNKVRKPVVTALENLEEKRIRMHSIGGNQETLDNTPRFLLEELHKEATPQGFQFSDYPQFSLYAGYMILNHEINSEELFREIEYLFDEILNKLATGDEIAASSSTPRNDNRREKLLQLFKDFKLLEKLFALELSRDDWYRSQERRESLSIEQMLDRLTGLYFEGDSEKKVMGDTFKNRLHELWVSGFDFYRYARDREDVFFSRIRSQMDELQADKAILVTGGFHTEGLKELFRENDISYGTLTPRISDLGDETLYRHAMLGTTPTIFDLAQIEIWSLLQNAELNLDVVNEQFLMLQELKGDSEKALQAMLDVWSKQNYSFSEIPSTEKSVVRSLTIRSGANSFNLNIRKTETGTLAFEVKRSAGVDGRSEYRSTTELSEDTPYDEDVSFRQAEVLFAEFLETGRELTWDVALDIFRVFIGEKENENLKNLRMRVLTSPFFNENELNSFHVKSFIREKLPQNVRDELGIRDVGDGKHLEEQLNVAIEREDLIELLEPVLDYRYKDELFASWKAEKKKADFQNKWPEFNRKLMGEIRTVFRDHKRIRATKILNLANRVIPANEGSSQRKEKILSVALEIYGDLARTNPQLFYDLEGFRPANGHHRLAWFFMNYLLHRNGMEMFHFKEGEYEAYKKGEITGGLRTLLERVKFRDVSRSENRQEMDREFTEGSRKAKEFNDLTKDPNNPQTKIDFDKYFWSLDGMTESAHIKLMKFFDFEAAEDIDFLKKLGETYADNTFGPSAFFQVLYKTLEGHGVERLLPYKRHLMTIQNTMNSQDARLVLLHTSAKSGDSFPRTNKLFLEDFLNLDSSFAEKVANALRKMDGAVDEGISGGRISLFVEWLKFAEPFIDTKEKFDQVVNFIWELHLNSNAPARLDKEATVGDYLVALRNARKAAEGIFGDRSSWFEWNDINMVFGTLKQISEDYGASQFFDNLPQILKDFESRKENRLASAATHRLEALNRVREQYAAAIEFAEKAQKAKAEGRLDEIELPKVGFVTDIHGNLDALNQALEAFEREGQDLFVFGGDYMDRGQNGIAVMEKVLELVKEGKAKALMGNHDLWFILSAMGDRENFADWLGNGGLEVLKEQDLNGFSDEQIESFKQLEKRLNDRFEADDSEGHFVNVVVTVAEGPEELGEDSRSMDEADIATLQEDHDLFDDVFEAFLKSEKMKKLAEEMVEHLDMSYLGELSRSAVHAGIHVESDISDDGDVTYEGKFSYRGRKGHAGLALVNGDLKHAFSIGDHRHQVFEALMNNPSPVWARDWQDSLESDQKFNKHRDAFKKYVHENLGSASLYVGHQIVGDQIREYDSGLVIMADLGAAYPAYGGVGIITVDNELGTVSIEGNQKKPVAEDGRLLEINRAIDALDVMKENLKAIDFQLKIENDLSQVNRKEFRALNNLEFDVDEGLIFNLLTSAVKDILKKHGEAFRETIDKIQLLGLESDYEQTIALEDSGLDPLKTREIMRDLQEGTLEIKEDVEPGDEWKIADEDRQPNAIGLSELAGAIGGSLFANLSSIDAEKALHSPIVTAFAQDYLKLKDLNLREEIARLLFEEFFKKSDEWLMESERGLHDFFNLGADSLLVTEFRTLAKSNRSQEIVELESELNLLPSYFSAGLLESNDLPAPDYGRALTTLLRVRTVVQKSRAENRSEVRSGEIDWESFNRSMEIFSDSIPYENESVQSPGWLQWISGASKLIPFSTYVRRFVNRWFFPVNVSFDFKDVMQFDAELTGKSIDELSDLAKTQKIPAVLIEFALSDMKVSTARDLEGIVRESRKFVQVLKKQSRRGKITLDQLQTLVVMRLKSFEINASAVTSGGVHFKQLQSWVVYGDAYMTQLEELYPDHQRLYFYTDMVPLSAISPEKKSHGLYFGRSLFSDDLQQAERTADRALDSQDFMAYLRNLVKGNQTQGYIGLDAVDHEINFQNKSNIILTDLISILNNDEHQHYPLLKGIQERFLAALVEKGLVRSDGELKAPLLLIDGPNWQTMLFAAQAMLIHAHPNNVEKVQTHAFESSFSMANSFINMSNAAARSEVAYLRFKPGSAGDAKTGDNLPLNDFPMKSYEDADSFYYFMSMLFSGLVPLDAKSRALSQMIQLENSWNAQRELSREARQEQLWDFIANDLNQHPEHMNFYEDSSHALSLFKRLGIKEVLVDRRRNALRFEMLRKDGGSSYLYGSFAAPQSEKWEMNILGLSLRGERVSGHLKYRSNFYDVSVFDRQEVRSHQPKTRFELLIRRVRDFWNPSHFNSDARKTFISESINVNRSDVNNALRKIQNINQAITVSVFALTVSSLIFPIFGGWIYLGVTAAIASVALLWFFTGYPRVLNSERVTVFRNSQEKEAFRSFNQPGIGLISLISIMSAVMVVPEGSQRPSERELLSSYLDAARGYTNVESLPVKQFWVQNENGARYELSAENLREKFRELLGKQRVADTFEARVRWLSEVFGDSTIDQQEITQLAAEVSAGTRSLRNSTGDTSSPSDYFKQRSRELFQKLEGLAALVNADDFESLFLDPDFNFSAPDLLKVVDVAVQRFLPESIRDQFKSVLGKMKREDTYAGYSAGEKILRDLLDQQPEMTVTQKSVFYSWIDLYEDVKLFPSKIARQAAGQMLAPEESADKTFLQVIDKLKAPFGAAVSSTLKGQGEFGVNRVGMIRQYFSNIMALDFEAPSGDRLSLRSEYGLDEAHSRDALQSYESAMSSILYEVERLEVLILSDPTIQFKDISDWIDQLVVENNIDEFLWSQPRDQGGNPEALHLLRNIRIQLKGHFLAEISRRPKSETSSFPQWFAYFKGLANLQGDEFDRRLTELTAPEYQEDAALGFFLTHMQIAIDTSVLKSAPTPGTFKSEMVNLTSAMNQNQKEILSNFIESRAETRMTKWENFMKKLVFATTTNVRRRLPYQIASALENTEVPVKVIQGFLKGAEEGTINQTTAMTDMLIRYGVYLSPEFSDEGKVKSVYVAEAESERDILQSTYNGKPIYLFTPRVLHRVSGNQAAPADNVHGLYSQGSNIALSLKSSHMGLAKAMEASFMGRIEVGTLLEPAQDQASKMFVESNKLKLGIRTFLLGLVRRLVRTMSRRADVPLAEGEAQVVKMEGVSEEVKKRLEASLSALIANEFLEQPGTSADMLSHKKERSTKIHELAHLINELSDRSVSNHADGKEEMSAVLSEIIFGNAPYLALVSVMLKVLTRGDAIGRDVTKAIDALYEELYEGETKAEDSIIHNFDDVNERAGALARRLEYLAEFERTEIQSAARRAYTKEFGYEPETISLESFTSVEIERQEKRVVAATREDVEAYVAKMKYTDLSQDGKVLQVDVSMDSWFYVEGFVKDLLREDIAESVKGRIQERVLGNDAVMAKLVLLHQHSFMIPGIKGLEGNEKIEFIDAQFKKLVYQYAQDHAVMRFLESETFEFEAPNGTSLYEFFENSPEKFAQAVVAYEALLRSQERWKEALENEGVDFVFELTPQNAQILKDHIQALLTGNMSGEKIQEYRDSLLGDQTSYKNAEVGETDFFQPLLDPVTLSPLSNLFTDYARGNTVIEVPVDFAAFKPTIRLPGEISKTERAGMKAVADLLGIGWTVHSPIVGPANNFNFLLEDMADNPEIAKKAVEYAIDIGAFSIVMHIADRTSSDAPARYAEIVKHAANYQREFGESPTPMKIAFENYMSKKLEGGKKPYSSAAEHLEAFGKIVRQLIQEGRADALIHLGVLFDSAHLNLSNSLEDPVESLFKIKPFVDQLREAFGYSIPELNTLIDNLIVELHLNQNNGPTSILYEMPRDFGSDIHEDIESKGTIDNEAFIALVRALGFKPAIIAEQKAKVSAEGKALMESGLALSEKGIGDLAEIEVRGQSRLEANNKEFLKTLGKEYGHLIFESDGKTLRPHVSFIVGLRSNESEFEEYVRDYFKRRNYFLILSAFQGNLSDAELNRVAEFTDGLELRKTTSDNTDGLKLFQQSTPVQVDDPVYMGIFGTFKAYVGDVGEVKEFDIPNGSLMGEMARDWNPTSAEIPEVTGGRTADVVAEGETRYWSMSPLLLNDIFATLPELYERAGDIIERRKHPNDRKEKRVSEEEIALIRKENPELERALNVLVQELIQKNVSRRNIGIAVRNFLIPDEAVWVGEDLLSDWDELVEIGKELFGVIDKAFSWNDLEDKKKIAIRLFTIDTVVTYLDQKGTFSAKVNQPVVLEDISEPIEIRMTPKTRIYVVSAADLKSYLGVDIQAPYAAVQFWSKSNGNYSLRELLPDDFVNLGRGRGISPEFSFGSDVSKLHLGLEMQKGVLRVHHASKTYPKTDVRTRGKERFERNVKIYKILNRLIEVANQNNVSYKELEQQLEIFVRGLRFQKALGFQRNLFGFLEKEIGLLEEAEALLGMYQDQFSDFLVEEREDRAVEQIVVDESKWLEFQSGVEQLVKDFYEYLVWRRTQLDLDASQKSLDEVKRRAGRFNDDLNAYNKQKGEMERAARGLEIDVKEVKETMGLLEGLGIELYRVGQANAYRDTQLYRAAHVDFEKAMAQYLYRQLTEGVEALVLKSAAEDFFFPHGRVNIPREAFDYEGDIFEEQAQLLRITRKFFDVDNLPPAEVGRIRAFVIDILQQQIDRQEKRKIDDAASKKLLDMSFVQETSKSFVTIHGSLEGLQLELTEILPVIENVYETAANHRAWMKGFSNPSDVNPADEIFRCGECFNASRLLQLLIRKKEDGGEEKRYEVEVMALRGGEKAIKAGEEFHYFARLKIGAKWVAVDLTWQQFLPENEQDPTKGMVLILPLDSQRASLILTDLGIPSDKHELWVKPIEHFESGQSGRVYEESVEVKASPDEATRSEVRLALNEAFKEGVPAVQLALNPGRLVMMPALPAGPAVAVMAGGFVMPLLNVRGQVWNRAPNFAAQMVRVANVMKPQNVKVVGQVPAIVRAQEMDALRVFMMNRLAQIHEFRGKLFSPAVGSAGISPEKYEGALRNFKNIETLFAGREHYRDFKELYGRDLTIGRLQGASKVTLNGAVIRSEAAPGLSGRLAHVLQIELDGDFERMSKVDQDAIMNFVLSAAILVGQMRLDGKEVDAKMLRSQIMPILLQLVEAGGLEFVPGKNGQPDKLKVESIAFVTALVNAFRNAEKVAASA